MKDHWKKVGPVWKMLSLGLVAILMATAVATGCDSELFDDQIWPIDEVREECFDEPDSWRCNDDVAELCRNGWWNPWYNCAWNGGTCEVAVDEYGTEIPGMAGCVDPAEQQIECGTDIWDTSGTDPDAGAMPLPSDCSMCDPAPTDPADFAAAVPNASDGVLGCCAADGNAYWGVDAVVMQSCSNGCCAFIDFTSTMDAPAPIRHGCCE